MAPVIQLSDHEVQELAAIAKNCDSLSEIVTKSAEIGPMPGISAIARRLSKVLGQDRDQIILMVYGLVHAYRVQPDYGVSSEEAVEAITNSLERADRPDVLREWKDAKTKIIQALKGLDEEHPLVVSHEAAIASNSRANIVSSMKLLTDTRSVFNEDGGKVLFTVINHTLLVEYLEGYGRKEIQFSLDAEDVACLASLCMDADTQASALKEIISGPAGRPYEYEAEDE